MGMIWYAVSSEMCNAQNKRKENRMGSEGRGIVCVVVVADRKDFTRVTVPIIVLCSADCLSRSWSQ